MGTNYSSTISSYLVCCVVSATECCCLYIHTIIEMVTCSLQSCYASNRLRMWKQKLEMISENIDRSASSQSSIETGEKSMQFPCPWFELSFNLRDIRWISCMKVKLFLFYQRGYIYQNLDFHFTPGPTSIPDSSIGMLLQKLY